MTLGARMENGWPECDLSDCDYATIPGTPLRLPFRRGIPFAILQAFLRDLDAYVESANNSRGYSDEGSWTEDNSVYTSNHKGASAFDYNWSDHPMGVALAGWHGSDLIPGEQEPAVRELLAFYTYKGIQLVWWGNDWNSPKDSMHFQMGYNTANNLDICNEFIARFVRADGYSTLRRGNGPTPPAPLTRSDRYALATINEGRRLNISPKGICIALSVELVESNLTIYANSNVPESLNLPHDAVGSDHDSTGPFQQRQAWGPLSWTMDPTLSAQLFFLGGKAGQRGLTDFDYNSDSRTPGGWAQAVQVSAFPDRYDQRYAEASRLYDRLSTVTDVDPLEELLMSNPAVPSLSIYANPGEPPVPILTMIAAQDAHGPHEPYVEKLARAGDPDSLRRVARTAAGKGPYGTAAFAVNQALGVIADIEATNPAVIQAVLNGAS